MIEYESDGLSLAETFPPGEYIDEELKARGWTQEDLARILGKPFQAVNAIINAKKEITPETALALGKAFGTSAELWLNLEAAYRLDKARAKPRDPYVARRARLYTLAPIKELQKRGWIKKTDNIDQLEAEVCRFFELKSIGDEPILRMAARRGGPNEPLTSSHIAWAFRAKHLAARKSARAFDRVRFKELLPGLVRRSAEQDGIRRAFEDLTEAGVRVIKLEKLRKTKIDGAAFWLDSASPVVALSLRYRRIDYFWFTLMHELAHIREEKIAEGHMDSELGETRTSETKESASEHKADSLASNWLIPQRALDTFVRKNRPFFGRKAIETFARDRGIHPAIVVGRLQHAGTISYSHLRTMLGKLPDIAEE
jgi:HTH-type transcriptional regulator/antitoxin HigA